MTGIRFDRATRRLVMGEKECHGCQHNRHYDIPAGRRVDWRSSPCDACKGTGKRGNGNCRACKYDAGKYGAGNVRDLDKPFDAGQCPTCHGHGTEESTLHDYVSAEVMAEILEVTPIKVYARDRELSWGEAHMGILPSGSGIYEYTLWSIQDYGKGMARHLEDPDAFVAEVLGRLANDRSTQGVKLARKSDGLVVDHLGVLLAHDGYTLVGVMEPLVVEQTD